MKATDTPTIDQLMQRIDQLTQELEAERTHSLHLRNELESIRSLKKHAKHVFRKRLVAADVKIQQNLQSSRTFSPLIPSGVNDSSVLDEVARFDARNFAAYNHAMEDSRALHTYDVIKQSAKKLLGKKEA